jgi:Zn-dependent M28 family amino/carboxypeptidase
MEETNWIGETYVSTFGWDVLEEIVDMGPRLGGSDGERRAQRRVQEAFEEAGAREIGEHTFDVEGWSRGDSSLRLDEPHEVELECIALPGSPPDVIEGEFVHLGHGLPEDFEAADLEGKIAVVSSDVPDWYDHWMHRREKYGLAIRHGARAFVFANHVEGSLAPTGSLAGGIDVVGDIPAIGVSKEVGARIERYAGRSSVRGALRVEADIGETTSQNVMAVVGPETETEILVGAHVDGHDISQAAVDNGVGVATMCEVARILGRRQEALETKVRFVGFGCEELGLVGSQHYAADHDVSSIDVVVNLDGIGDGRNQRIHTNRFDDLRPVVEAVADELQHPVEWVPEYVLHSDHWPFVWRGVPGLMFCSESDTPGRGFCHTTADTLDKVDVREIREHAIVATRLIERLADGEVEIARKSADEVESYLWEKGAFEYLDRSGDWPY